MRPLGVAAARQRAEPPAVPTLVLLPGLACDGALWRDQLAPLAAAGPVVVAQAHSQADSLLEMASLLLQQHPGRLALAGCSMGAMLALAAWRQAPERIAGLALMGTTALPDTAAVKALRRDAITQFAQGRVAAVLRANAMLAFHPDHGPRLLADYLAMVLRAGAEGLIRQNRAVMARADLRPVLPTVRCPTLVVGGLDDLLTPPERQREIADAIVGAELHLLPRCGHMLSWEQPEVVTRLLMAWRQRLG